MTSINPINNSSDNSAYKIPEKIKEKVVSRKGLELQTMESDPISHIPLNELLDESFKAKLPPLLFAVEDIESHVEIYGNAVHDWLENKSTDPKTRREVKRVKVLQYDPDKEELIKKGRIIKNFDLKNKEDRKKNELMDLLIKACNVDNALSEDQHKRMQSIQDAYNYADATLKLGQEEEALKWFERALNATSSITENPLELFKKKLFEGFKLVANSYLKKGNYQKAIEVADKITDESLKSPLIQEILKAIDNIVKNLLLKGEIDKAIDFINLMPTGSLKNDMMYIFLDHFFSENKFDAAIPFLNFLTNEAEEKNDTINLTLILKYKFQMSLALDFIDEGVSYSNYVYEKAIKEPHADIKIIALINFLNFAISCNQKNLVEKVLQEIWGTLEILQDDGKKSDALVKIWQHYTQFTGDYQDLAVPEQLIKSVNISNISKYLDLLFLISDAYISKQQFVEAVMIFERIFYGLGLQENEQKKLEMMKKISSRLDLLLQALINKGDCEKALNLIERIPILHHRLNAYCDIAFKLDMQDATQSRALNLMEKALLSVELILNDDDKKITMDKISYCLEFISHKFTEKNNIDKSLEVAQKISNEIKRDKALLNIVFAIHLLMKPAPADDFLKLMNNAIYAARKLSDGFQAQVLSHLAKKLIERGFIAQGMEIADESLKAFNALVSKTDDEDVIELFIVVKDNLTELSENLAEKAYFKESLIAALMIPYEFTRATTLLHISEIFWKCNQSDWLDVVWLAIDTAKGIEDKEISSSALSDIVDAFCKTASKLLQEDPISKEGLWFLDEASTVAGLIPDKMSQTEAFIQITDLLLAAGHLDKATNSAKKAVIANKMINNGDDSEIEKFFTRPDLLKNFNDIEKKLAFHRINKDTQSWPLFWLSEELFLNDKVNQALEIAEEALNTLLSKGSDSKSIEIFFALLSKFIKTAKKFVLNENKTEPAIRMIKLGIKKLNMVSENKWRISWYDSEDGDFIENDEFLNTSMEIEDLINTIVNHLLSIKELNKALEMARLIPLELRRSKFLLNLSKTFFSIPEDDIFYKSVKIALQAASDLQEEDEKTDMLIEISQFLENAAHESLKKDRENGIKLLEMSIFAATCIPDPDPKGEELSALASILFTINEFDRGIVIAHEAIKIKHSYGTTVLSTVSENLASGARALAFNGQSQNAFKVAELIPDEEKKAELIRELEKQPTNSNKMEID